MFGSNQSISLYVARSEILKYKYVFLESRIVKFMTLESLVNNNT